MIAPHHLMICGFGAVGERLAQFAASASRGREAILVVEREWARAEAARKQGFRVVEGDAASHQVLRIAQIASAAEVQVCVGDSDAESIIRQVTAVAPATMVKAVLRNQEHREAAIESGARQVVVLSEVAGMLLAESALETDGNNSPSGN